MPRTLLVAAVTALLLLPGAANASASGVVVSQIYGGGGNAGALFRNDYVELFNGGAGAADVSGWTIQYATSAGTSWQATPLSGSIAAGHYYLVQLASGGTTGAALPAADATGTTNLAATSGKIALVRGTAALTCGATSGSCSGTPLVEDLVGYGDATDFEGAGTAPAPSNTDAAIRASAGCTDTGDNAADFAAAAAAPRNSTTSAHACASTPSSGGTAHVDVDVGSVLSVSLDRASLGFGAASAGATPTPLPENVTVSSNNAAAYTLAITRTTSAPRDLPLAVGATAPAGASLAPPLATSALVAIPVSPSAALAVGSKDSPSATAGDTWPTRIGFSAPLPLVPTGRYSATVTYSVVAR